MKQLTIIGNLGQDATIRDVNGSKFLEFSVAVNERYKKADGTTVETTDWINCTYRQLGVAPYLRKGDKILVQGNMKVNVYQAKDRSHKAGINLNAFNVQLLGGKKEEGEGTTTVEPPAAAASPADDLPF